MIVLLDKQSLYSTFGVNDFYDLELSINNLSPSMVEYYLSDIASENSNSSYLNKSNIEKTILFDEYFLYLDYNQDIYLEITQDSTANDFESNTLW